MPADLSLLACTCVVEGDHSSSTNRKALENLSGGEAGRRTRAFKRFAPALSPQRDGHLRPGEFESRFPQENHRFYPSEPNQVRVIHVFFYCGGSPGLLIHAYSWHNRSKSGSSVTVPRAESGGEKSPELAPTAVFQRENRFRIRVRDPTFRRTTHGSTEE